MKQITKTPEIMVRLRKAVGPDVDLDSLVVYEATAINTLPLRKKHPLFDGSILSEDLLYEMELSVANESVQLRVNHEGEGLPIGRVFHGRVLQTEGMTELRSLFFLPKSAEREIELIDSGTVDQVSIQILPKKILCSTCNFNFLGAESSMENIMAGTCSDGHVLNENGVHGKLEGLDSWLEMSLVGMGGARQAKIHSKSSSLLSENQLNRLAATGCDPNVLVLRLSSQELSKVADTDKKVVTFDVGELVAKFAADSVAKTAAEARVVELETKVGEAVAWAAELKTALDAAPKPEALTELEARNTELAAAAAEAEGFVTELAGQFAVAAGMAVPADLKFGQAKELIASSRAKLKTLLPLGASATGSIADSSQRPIASTGAYLRKR